ncbi:MAG: COQ9 family protein, partial [Caulobacterales bacterium]|nr:COQ9 family protein [Caulobacterales bacterium]
LLEAALPLASALGWGQELVDRAAQRIGLSKADAALLLPHGTRDLAALLSQRHNAVTATSLAALDPQGLKIRQKIRAGVLAWLDAHAADGEATRRATGFLALPPNLPLAARLTWGSADLIWRWAGDIATDENHYSKRAILSGILVSTLAIDQTQGRAAASEHLDARIDNVMSFEKWKAGLPKPSEMGKSLAGALGRLRFGG